MEWIRKNIRQTILIAFITVVFSTAGSLFVYEASTKANKVDKAASIDYVNDKANDLKGYIDVQDADIKIHLNAIDARLETKADKYHVESIEKKIDVIYTWVINQNKLKP